MSPSVTYGGKGRLRVPRKGANDVVLEAGENDVSDDQAKFLKSAKLGKRALADVHDLSFGEAKQAEKGGAS